MSELPTDLDTLLEAVEAMMGEEFARHMSERVYVAFQVGQLWPDRRILPRFAR